MRKLYLQENELTSIPAYLLELQNLSELNLSRNKLTGLPTCQQWSSSLTSLDLSQNRISALPTEIRAARIHNINLASNELNTVPLCICDLSTLQALDLSDNKDIQVLPVQMGRLRNLIELNLTGLKKLKDPPKDMIQNPKECIQYLSNKLYCLKPFYRMKLVLVGMQNRGKTTLAARLEGRECGNESTVGVDISDWEYKPTIMKKSFSFSVWDFGGQEEYYATHQCFLSEGSIYLLVFSVTSGNIALDEVRSWLTNIALRTPGSCIHIVGTHLDEIPAEQREQLNILLHKIGDVASNFSDKLQIKDIIAIGLKNELENVSMLKESIYNSASEFQLDDKVVMGQMVPASYHVLDKSLSDLQKSTRKGIRPPIMNKEEFKSFIYELDISDFKNDDDLHRVTQFLTNVGTILHYDDRSHNLDNLYFVDPLWLCNMMSRIIAVREKNPFINNGLMEVKNIPQILHDDQFPVQYFNQYLALLDRFEIALVLDKHNLLIPSMLSDVRPGDVDEKIFCHSNEMLYTRYIAFDSPITPPGYWSRLISRIMHSIPQVQFIMDKNRSDDVNADGDNIQSYSFILSSSCSNQDSNVQLDISQVRLHYWRTGIFYKDSEVIFKIESLMRSRQYNSEGVLIMASPNLLGRKIFGQLIDLATSLFQEWYRGGRIKQMCPCFDCMQLNILPPFYFQIDNCLYSIAKNESTIECSNHHFVRLSDIVPDLLLLDINPKFLLDSSEIEYDDNEASLLGEGGFAKVYLGKCRKQSVAIKVFTERNSNAALLEDLRREAMLLQKFHHPCIVSLVGICTHPRIMLVLEEAPLGSLDKPLLKTKQPIHRIVIHRILAQVAAALKLLHDRGIIFRDLKAGNVLLWSLHPESLCHCKISDMGIAIHETPIGARGVQGTKGFIAPEVLHIGKKQHSIVYDHKADIFSFGMLIFQTIARMNPFENYKDVGIDSAVINGERPTLKNSPLAESAFFYLSELMQRCWDGNPRQRPTTTEIIEYLCLPSVQSVMCLQPLQYSPLQWQSCLLNLRVDAEANTSQDAKVVVCIEGDSGRSTEVSIFSINAMGSSKRNVIINNLVECIYPCGEHVLVSPRAGTELGVIYLLNIENGDLKSIAHSRTDTVSCITCSNDMIYCGTVEGYCFSMPINNKIIGSVAVTEGQKLSDHCIDSLVVASDFLWVSHTHHIRLLDLNTLAVVDTVTERGKSNRSLSRSSPARKRRATSSATDAKSKKTSIGQMKLSKDGETIWSSHLRYGSFISAWSVKEKKHLFEVDIEELLIAETQNNNEEVIISAMTPVLDTVWVGTTVGYILVIYNSDLLLWFRPYSEYICFLECIHSIGPSQTEEAMVVSGAKGFRSPVVKYQTTGDKSPVDKNGMIILWEAFPSKQCRQIRVIERESTSFLNSHGTVKEMVSKGHFREM